MCLRAPCVVCCAPVEEDCPSLWCTAVAVHSCPGETLPLCLMVLLEFLLPMHLGGLVGQFWGRLFGRLRTFSMLPHCDG